MLRSVCASHDWINRYIIIKCQIWLGGSTCQKFPVQIELFLVPNKHVRVLLPRAAAVHNAVSIFRPVKSYETCHEMATSIKLCAQNSAICLLCAKEFGQNLRNAGRRKILNASGQPHPEFTCLCEVLQVDIATDCLTQSYLCRQCFDSLAKLQPY